MRISPALAVLCSALFAAGASHADGWTLQEGRFPGKSVVVRLSQNQATRLDYIHKCRGKNSLTPYVFHLTREQSAILKHETGILATRFAVFDSMFGDSDVDLEINILVRFAPRQAEIPIELLATDRETRKYERQVIGWDRNPIEQASLSQVNSGKCPI